MSLTVAYRRPGFLAIRADGSAVGLGVGVQRLEPRVVARQPLVPRERPADVLQQRTVGVSSRNPIGGVKDGWGADSRGS